MLVTNRSNDIIYGSMGSNLFHFSMLHEYVAVKAGMTLGFYTQLSTNLHLYLENPVSKRVVDAVRNEEHPPLAPNPDYSLSELGLPWAEPFAEECFSNLVDWGDEKEGEGDYIKRVARPLMNAYRLFKKSSWENELVTPSKEERIMLACEALEDMPSPLGQAGIRWLERKL
jgi:hypothetical protein